MIQIKLEEMNNFLHSLALYENQIRDDSFESRIRVARSAINKGNINRKQLPPAKREIDFLK